MTDDRAKTPRTLLIADHLWEAFSTMAVEMGGDRDALINQALYTFARLNGFLVAADLRKLGFPQPALPAAMESSRPRPAPQLVSVPHGNPESVAKIAQQLASGGQARPISSPPPMPPNGAPVKPEPSLVEVDDSLLGEEGQATSMELPNIAESLGGMKVPPRPSAPIIAQHHGEEATVTPGGRTLVLLADGRELDRVIKDRFLIGRGKHCDLIINSGKVSREHAAITREGSAWFIEDLGSSNGTWFDKRRISSRQIQDGDEYYICSEKIGCAFR